jgi:hypothetical protein
MRISQYAPDVAINLPVSGGGTALVRGALLKRGPTPGTNNGTLVLASTNAANPDTLAILRENHATADDTLVDGTVFKTHPCDIIVPGRIVRIEYSKDAADDIEATQAVSTTTITLASLEDNIDAAFLYVVAGTGIGQTNYLTASAAGSATLKAAFGTSLDTTSRLIKILPRFHQLASLTADGTKLSSQAAAGQWPVIVLDTIIVRNGNEQQMSPVTHAALTGLNGNASLRFEADILIRDTMPYTLD